MYSDTHFIMASKTPVAMTEKRRKKSYQKSILYFLSITSTAFVYTLFANTFTCVKASLDQDYYYTRTRSHPNHLRVAEHFKNKYLDEIKLESTINGTKWDYYKSNKGLSSSDELIFETIDKMFRHRLSPFYIHTYDNEEDKRRSFDKQRVSQELCARDLLYLVDKLYYGQQQFSDNSFSEGSYLTPELSAFFDSFARPEAGIFKGNTYWIGAYEQCVTRHIFDMVDLTGRRSNHDHHQQASTSVFGSAEHEQNNDKNQVVSFGGRYCVASIKSPKWKDMIERRKSSSGHYFRTKQELDDYSKLFRLQLGICLPDSCDSSSLERHHDELKLLTKHALGAGKSQFANYELFDLFCLPDDNSPLRQWSGSALGFTILVGSWIIIVLLATLADVCEFVPSPSSSPSSKGVSVSLLVNWLSVRANYRKLMHVPEDEHDLKKPKATPVADLGKDASGCNSASETKTPQDEGPKPAKDLIRVNLRFLNAFKVIVMFWIVNGHIMMLMIQTAKNILDSDALLNGLMHFLIGATFGVDLFFTITGFLTAYLLFNSGQIGKMKIGHWLYLSFHRYWRLAPMYLLAFWFSRSVMQLLGSGPLWDYGTSAITYRGLCNQESWWYPLTLTSNLHGLFEECMITSWYISCDMQFWLVSPLYLHLLMRNPASGWLASLATILASSKIRYDSLLEEKAARYDELVQPRADIFMRVSHDLPALYTHPHYRISAYLVGLLAGHYVYMIKSGLWSSVLVSKSRKQAEDTSPIEQDDKNTVVEEKRSEKGELTCEAKKLETNHRGTRFSLATASRNVLAYTGLFLVLLMAFASFICSNYFPQSLLQYSRQISAYAYALDHLLMSLGASLILVTMCLGQWPRLVHFLSHPNWTRLSKINYALLLFQCEAIYFEIFRYEQVPLAGTRQLINILFNLLITLYPLALAVTLFFEFPLANIEKLLLRGGGGGKREATK